MRTTRVRLHSRHRALVAGIVLLPALVAAPWMVVRATTASSIHPARAEFETADAAIVLGARVYEDGRPSRFLRERVETGVALYEAGAVTTLIMSGDGHDSSGFGEPTVMRRVAEEMGVPAEAIVEDPLGLDTYSSCHHARDHYGMTSVIVVSQEFHVPRAVWICEQLGVAVQGAYPPPRLTRSTVVGHAREVAAVGKAMVDVLRNRQPGNERTARKAPRADPARRPGA